MAVIDSQYRTITCNTCGKSATFEPSPEGVKEALEKNPWIKTVRIIQQISTGRNFAYDSDECELAGVASGAHNPEEPKKVIPITSSGAIQQAAAAAAQAEAATRDIKSGNPVTLHTT